MKKFILFIFLILTNLLIADDRGFELDKLFNELKNTNSKLSEEIEIRPMNRRDLEKYCDKIQELYMNLIQKSKFHGPIFNTDSFKLLNKKKFFKINGYFLNNEL